jgi:secreted protein with Ig-like and vWFA domain
MTTPPQNYGPEQRLDTQQPLTDDEQLLLTAAALDQLEAGLAEQPAVDALLSEDVAEVARTFTDETQRLAAAAQESAQRETAALADDPFRQDLRRAVLAAIAAERQPASPASGKARRRLIGWLSIGSLAAAALVMLAFLPVTVESPAPSKQDRRLAMRTEEPLAESAAPSRPSPAAPEKQQAAPAVPPVDALARAAGSMPGRERASRQAQAKAAAPGPRAAAEPLAVMADEAADASAIAPAASALARSAEVGRRVGVGMMRAPAGVGGNALELDYADKAVQLEPRRWPQASGETYAPITENQLHDPLTEPLSTFSVDVDTASYANVRRFLTSGRRPPRDAVRIEELINYFSYDDPAPTGDDPFAVSLEAAASPWHADRLVVRISLKARDFDRRERPAGNLVFLVDVSGSMSAANKLPLVKQSLKLLVGELGANDRISLVTYAGQAALRLPPTPGNDKATILAAIDGLASGGSTHGSAGIEMAYAQAAEHFVEGGVNRVLLATDGDLNVGITSDTALEALIREKAQSGVFLTVLGFGEGNLQDAKMERIADKGNGIYAYIDGLREARKVLVEQLTGSTITVAKDVKLQVEFNPATVAGYRLIGYENRLLAAQDFRDDTKDAGEIGAGHSVTALYEIVPRGVAPGRGAEPLKYQQQPEPPVVLADETGEPSDDLLTVKLRWKQPEGSTSQLAEFPLADRGGAFEAASTDLRFAAAVASFGLLLRGSDKAGSVNFAKTAQIASEALGADPAGYRTEFVDLVRKAAGR